MNRPFQCGLSVLVLGAAGIVLATRWRREPTAASRYLEQVRRQLAEVELAIKTLLQEIESNRRAEDSTQDALKRAEERDGQIFAQLQRVADACDQIRDAVTPDP